MLSLGAVVEFFFLLNVPALSLPAEKKSANNSIWFNSSFLFNSSLHPPSCNENQSIEAEISPNDFVNDHFPAKVNTTVAEKSMYKVKTLFYQDNETNYDSHKTHDPHTSLRNLGRTNLKHLKKGLLNYRKDLKAAQLSSIVSPVELTNRSRIDVSQTTKSLNDSFKSSAIHNPNEETPWRLHYPTNRTVNCSQLFPPSHCYSSHTAPSKSIAEGYSFKKEGHNLSLSVVSTQREALLSREPLKNGSHSSPAYFEFLMTSATLFRSKAQQVLNSRSGIRGKNETRNTLFIMDNDELSSQEAAGIHNDVEPEARSGVIPPQVIQQYSESSKDQKKKIEISVAYTPQDFVSNEEPLATYVLGNGAKPFPGKDIYVYCYPFNEKQIMEKCSGAKDLNAVGVYIPMMMEIQIKHERSWYGEIRRLKRLTQLNVIGISYDNPNWNLITDILLSNPRLFDGVLIEWSGQNACISHMEPPTINQLQIIKEETRYGILRYFVNEQNFLLCNTPPINFVSTHEYLNLKDIKNVSETFGPILKKPDGFFFPQYIQPVFGCMGGHEGFCFKAFSNTPDLACSSWQRYIFNPYEYVGGRMLHMLNESCHGLPQFDLYGVV